MITLEDLFQSADLKTEKHIPVVEIPDKIKKEEYFKIVLNVGEKSSYGYAG